MDQPALDTVVPFSQAAAIKLRAKFPASKPYLDRAKSALPAVDAREVKA